MGVLFVGEKFGVLKLLPESYPEYFLINGVRLEKSWS